MLSVLMAALPTHTQAHMRITPAVIRCLQMWQDRVTYAPSSPVHFEEIVPPSPESFGAHDACLDGIGGVFFGTDGTPFVWNLALPHALHGQHHINVLELAAHGMQLFVRTPWLPVLMHTLDGMDNTVAMA